MARRPALSACWLDFDQHPDVGRQVRRALTQRSRGLPGYIVPPHPVGFGPGVSVAD